MFMTCPYRWMNADIEKPETLKNGDLIEAIIKNRTAFGVNDHLAGKKLILERRKYVLNGVKQETQWHLTWGNEFVSFRDIKWWRPFIGPEGYGGNIGECPFDSKNKKLKDEEDKEGAE